MIVEFRNVVVVDDDTNGNVKIELAGDGRPVNLSDLHRAIQEADLLPVSKAQLHDATEKVVFTECLHSHITNQTWE